MWSFFGDTDLSLMNGSLRLKNDFELCILCLQRFPFAL